MAHGSCTYFCADKEEKFCGDTPEQAERKMSNDPKVRKQHEEQVKQAMIRDREVCQGFGFKPDSDGMANCILVQNQNRLAIKIKAKEEEIEGAKANAQAWQDAAESIGNAGKAIGQDIGNNTMRRAPVYCSSSGNSTICY